MPIEITPSDQVVIDTDKATDDDFLQIKLEDGQMIFLREGGHKYRSFAFDAQFMPADFVQLSLEAAERWLRRVDIHESVKQELKSFYDGRSDPNQHLREFIAERLRADVQVVGINPRDNNHIPMPLTPNIGFRLRASFGREITGITARSNYDSHEWHPEAKIVTITATDRFSIELAKARGYG